MLYNNYDIMRRILYLLPLLFIATFATRIYPQSIDVYYINISSKYNATTGTLGDITSLPPNVIFQPFNVSYTDNAWQYYPNNNLFIVQSNISIDPNVYQNLLQYRGIELVVTASGPTYIWINTNNVQNVTFSCTSSSCSNQYNITPYLSPGTNIIYIATQNQQPSPYFNFYYNLFNMRVTQDTNISIAIANLSYLANITYTNPITYIQNISYLANITYTNPITYIQNLSYVRTYQPDGVAQITRYNVTISNGTKTVTATATVTGSIPINILIVPYLIGPNNTYPNITNYQPNIVINGVNYGNTPWVYLQFQPTRSTYYIQITDNYPQYKTAIAIFTWNPSRNFVYVYGLHPALGTVSYTVGTPILTSYTSTVNFLYAIPIYIFPHNTVSDAVFAILVNKHYIENLYRINISCNSFIIMRYNPGLNSYQLLPYFSDNMMCRQSHYDLLYVRIPQVTAMTPVILYLFVTNTTNSDFSRPSSVFNYFVNLQESGYYSLLNLYTNGTVTYQQTPLGLQVNVHGGQLGFYIS